jgi:7,8-dihydropterin-6-yl-methyl-4-(beta-D-ribofuranosyl)aminobenzene 5'-phosphate synthase
MQIGGMLKAISLINTAKSKATATAPSKNVTIDLHPARPDFRGVTLPNFQMSLEADPTFDEITAAGGIVEKNDKTHTILDDFFLVSGEIPRQTSYEKGIRRGARFSAETGKWESDELILDERFLMCKLKGTANFHHD